MIGIVSDVTLTQSQFKGNVSSGDFYAGGLIGHAYAYGNSSVNNSYVNATITGDSYVGGLIGNAYYRYSIQNNYFTGKVVGENTSTGYLVGDLRLKVDDGYKLSSNYVVSTDSDQNSYYKITGNDATGQVVNSSMKTPAEMKSKDTFIGWDFNNIWEIKEGQYPTLRNVGVVTPEAPPAVEDVDEPEVEPVKPEVPQPQPEIDHKPKALELLKSAALIRKNMQNKLTILANQGVDADIVSLNNNITNAKREAQAEIEKVTNSQDKLELNLQLEAITLLDDATINAAKQTAAQKRKEAEDKRLEEERQRAEKEYKEKAEAARLEKERKEKAEAARLEKERKEKAEAARLEKERKEKAEAARLEKERKEKAEAARLEKERKEKAEAARLEKERKEKAEAARLEKERKEKAEAARLEKERKEKAEAARLEKERKEKAEAARLEKERKEKAEAARLEKERKEKAEAARLEKERKANEAKLKADQAQQSLATRLYQETLLVRSEMEIRLRKGEINLEEANRNINNAKSKAIVAVKKVSDESFKKQYSDKVAQITTLDAVKPVEPSKPVPSKPIAQPKVEDKITNKPTQQGNNITKIDDNLSEHYISDTKNSVLNNYSKWIKVDGKVNAINNADDYMRDIKEHYSPSSDDDSKDMFLSVLRGGGLTPKDYYLKAIDSINGQMKSLGGKFLENGINSIKNKSINNRFNAANGLHFTPEQLKALKLTSEEESQIKKISNVGNLFHSVSYGSLELNDLFKFRENDLAKSRTEIQSRAVAMSHIVKSIDLDSLDKFTNMLDNIHTASSIVDAIGAVKSVYETGSFIFKNVGEFLGNIAELHIEDVAGFTYQMDSLIDNITKLGTAHSDVIDFINKNFDKKTAKVLIKTYKDAGNINSKELSNMLRIASAFVQENYQRKLLSDFFKSDASSIDKLQMFAQMKLIQEAKSQGFDISNQKLLEIKKSSFGNSLFGSDYFLAK